MKAKWCVDSKTGEIFEYNIFTEKDGYEDGETDFPRGTLLVYDDYLTTGIASREEAEKWASENSPCHTCKSTSKGKPGDPCFRCGSELSKIILVRALPLALPLALPPYSTN